MEIVSVILSCELKVAFMVKYDSSMNYDGLWDNKTKGVKRSSWNICKWYNGLSKFRSAVSYPPFSKQILENIKLFWFCDKSLKMSTNDLILECVNIWLLTIKFKQRNPAQVKIIFSDPEQNVLWAPNIRFS